MAQQQMGFSMGQLLSDPNLSYFEKQRFLNSYEERMGIETETKRVQLEQQKLLHEGEKLKQSLLARAIESMTPGWERGGQRVDVGGFGTGGAPMQQVAVGPGQPGREITPATGPGVQYRQPGAEQQRMGQQFARTALGLTPEDPIEKFDRELEKIERQASIRSTLEEEKDIRGEKRAGIRETAREKQLDIKEKGLTARAEQKEAAQLKRDAVNAVHRDFKTAQEKYYGKIMAMQADPNFKLLRPEVQSSSLAALQGFYESWIRQIAITANNSGLVVDPTEYLEPPDISKPSQEQMTRTKKLKKDNPKGYKTFIESYEREHGKPFPLETK